MKTAIYNPQNRPVDELPTIYGYNEGGRPGWLVGVLIAEDGTELGEHISFHESLMPRDLGVLEEARADRHDVFSEHYPDGYRTEFVSFADVPTHLGLSAAIHRNQAQDRQVADTAA